jgi:hypothetical protein
VYSLLTALALGTSGCDRDVPLAAEPRPPQAAQQSRDSALAPTADTYIRQGNPNQNQGTEPILRLQASGKNRALVRWDPQGITGAIGGDSLVAARLELTITHNADNWSTAGRTVDLHRLTQAWTETGATWNCADDTNPANSAADCAGATAWAMDGPDPRPYVATPTATRLITNGLRGVVTFDVTADVGGLASGGGAPYGWILKKTDEGASGHVEFGSRESGSPPRLVLTLVSADSSRPPVPSGPLSLPEDSSTTVRRPGGDTANVYYRNVIQLTFHDSTSGPTVRDVLGRYGAQIIGGGSYPGITGGTYVILVPDPGPTFDALQELLSRLAAEPGVHHVRAMMFSARFEARSRFPNEAPGTRRVNWLNADSVTDGTRSRWAIRAPLAWGCETGTYATERVRVGVIDVVFVAGHADLPTARVLPIFDPTRFDQQLLIDRVLRSHGTGVAGVTAALGDNGLGIAGVLWAADLHLYPFGRGQVSVRDPYRRFEDMLADAGRRNVRVLVASLLFGDVQDDPAVTQVRQTLKQYLTAGVGNVLVIAAAYDPSLIRGQTLTLQQLRTTTDPRFFPLDRAAAQLVDTFPRQILFVVGTDSSNRFWKPSDFYTGGTQIAAPATGVLTLTDPSDYPGGTGAFDGTSFAAPFVAGVAGQLVAMDPTLTGEQVGDYILRGAQEPRLSPTTGLPVPRSPVDSAPGTVYQLDAYGALTLLSRERPDTPICGFPVAVDGFNGNTVRPEAPGRVPLPVAGATAIFSVSVAQGGRLIAAAIFDATAGRRVTVMNHVGNVVATLPPGIVERLFLERDTVDLSMRVASPPCGGVRPLMTRTGPSGPGTIDPMQRLTPTAVHWEPLGSQPQVTAASPLGDYVVFSGTYGFGPNCTDTVQQREDVIPFDPADSLVTVANLRFVFPSGPDPCGGVFCPFLDLPGAWSHDGRRLLLPLVQLVGPCDPFGCVASGVNTHLVRFLDLAAPDTINISGRGLLNPGFSADDSVVSFAEFDRVDQFSIATTCALTRRRASDATLLTTGPADLTLCDYQGPGPGKIFNLRASLIAAGAQRADAAMVKRVGPRSWPARLVGPRRAQAN